MNRPPVNIDVVDAATHIVLQRGLTVLQTHYYADTDKDHVATLLDWLDPPLGAMVIDAGSGLGEVSGLMADMRPDLAFLLVNLSQKQLSMGRPADGERIFHLCADFHDLRGFVPDRFANAVMFSSALCQMDTAVALAEAWRVLARDGVLLVNDMASEIQPKKDLEQCVAARVLSRNELIGMVENAGFAVDYVLTPESSDDHIRTMMAEAGHLDLLDGVYPIVIRAIKGERHGI